jgi:hypothetical protein
MGPAGNPEKAHAWLQHTRLVGPDVRISAADGAVAALLGILHEAQLTGQCRR